MILSLEHKTCGSVFEISVNSLFCGSYPCEECLKRRKSKEKKGKYNVKIEDIYNKKFSFIGDYLGIKNKTEFICNLCNNIFKDTPDILLQGKKKCPHCKQ